jgi:hypothetical protein
MICCNCVVTGSSDAHAGAQQMLPAIKSTPILIVLWRMSTLPNLRVLSLMIFIADRRMLQEKLRFPAAGRNLYFT